MKEKHFNVTRGLKQAIQNRGDKKFLAMDMFSYARKIVGKNIPHATMYNNLKKLVDSGLVIKLEERLAKKGRGGNPNYYIASKKLLSEDLNIKPIEDLDVKSRAAPLFDQIAKVVADFPRSVFTRQEMLEAISKDGVKLLSAKSIFPRELIKGGLIKKLDRGHKIPGQPIDGRTSTYEKIGVEKQDTTEDEDVISTAVEHEMVEDMQDIDKVLADRSIDILTVLTDKEGVVKWSVAGRAIMAVIDQQSIVIAKLKIRINQHGMTFKKKDAEIESLTIQISSLKKRVEITQSQSSKLRDKIVELEELSTTHKKLRYAAEERTKTADTDLENKIKELKAKLEQALSAHKRVSKEVELLRKENEKLSTLSVDNEGGHPLKNLERSLRDIG